MVLHYSSNSSISPDGNCGYTISCRDGLQSGKCPRYAPFEQSYMSPLTLLHSLAISICDTDISFRSEWDHNQPLIRRYCTSRCKPGGVIFPSTSRLEVLLEHDQKRKHMGRSLARSSVPSYHVAYTNFMHLNIPYPDLSSGFHRHILSSVRQDW